MAVVLDRAMEQRAREVSGALASVRMEGLEPSEEAKAIFQRYVNGEISSEEMDRLYDQYLDRTYGPVRISGNGRP